MKKNINEKNIRKQPTFKVFEFRKKTKKSKEEIDLVCNKMKKFFDMISKIMFNQFLMIVTTFSTLTLG